LETLDPWGKSAVVLFCGGDKASQQQDIRRAREYLTDYRRRPDA
jgi:putative component of toxin-antitoxin plasmid stabilization module